MRVGIHGLSMGFHALGNFGNAKRSLVQEPAYFGFLLRRRGPAAAELLSLRFGSLQTGLRAFDQQIAFELGHRAENTHCEFARGTRQIDAAQRQAMHPQANSARREITFASALGAEGRVFELRRPDHLGL